MVPVTVFGANGRTGRLIVETALSQGHDVTAAVRQPGQFAQARTSWPGPGRLTVAQADVRNPDTVDAAIRNSQAVISSIGTGRKPHGLYSTGTATIIDAMERRGAGAGRPHAKTWPSSASRRSPPTPGCAANQPWPIEGQRSPYTCSS